MSVATIVFSRDRPPQLDLCLRSLEKNLTDLNPITVIWKAGSALYEEGYALCAAQHPEVRFQREQVFREHVLGLLSYTDAPYAAFICDDDVAFRAAPIRIATDALDGSPDLLCFSLRLGRNTSRCYSLDLEQGMNPTAQTLGRPEHRMLFWNWFGQPGDWGYVGSLDGHIWRTGQLLRLIQSRDNWTGPNELEDCLNQACQTALLPLMASFAQSRLVGVPVNRVNSSHLTNRFGERYHSDPRTINDRYLRGGRLALESIVPSEVNAAHTEFPLRWAA